MVAVATLRAHVLRFHKTGLRDGSGKCDAFATGIEADLIWGAVYELDATDKSRLDSEEGLGRGYVERTVEVTSSAGLISAPTYMASPEAIRSALKPYSWYKDFVLAGAVEHGLPREYVDAIRAAPVVHDPDEARAAENEQILLGTKRIGPQAGH